MSVLRSHSGMKTLLAAIIAGSTSLACQSGIAVEAKTDQSVAKLSRTQTPTGWLARQSLYYKRNWGVEIVGVHPVSSGQMLTFRYRVLDESKAKPLFDKSIKPYLIDEATGTRLAVPAMENVGELRQDVTPKLDHIYYTIFGNPGKLVKRGSLVSIVIGNFHIDGLIVD